MSEVCASYKKLGITIPENFNQITAELSHNLESLGEIPVFWQHGDFCVNNMLIDKNVIGIVDFEHFGRVRMPFHDEFRPSTRYTDLPRGKPPDCGGIRCSGWSIGAFTGSESKTIIYQGCIYTPCFGG